MEMIILVGSALVAAILGAGLGARRVVTRTRYAAWRGALRAVPAAFRAFRGALIDLIVYGGVVLVVIAAWMLLIGVLV